MKAETKTFDVGGSEIKLTLDDANWIHFLRKNSPRPAMVVDLNSGNIVRIIRTVDGLEFARAK